jgi:hypothetical protein
MNKIQTLTFIRLKRHKFVFQQTYSVQRKSKEYKHCVLFEVYTQLMGESLFTLGLCLQNHK